MSNAEKTFIKRAESKGWHVLRAGWPDFMLVRQAAGGLEFQAVEVKTDHEDDPLRDTQRLMIAALVLQGIPVSVWSAESHTLRKVERLDAQGIIDNYFRKIEGDKVRTGLKELRENGVLVRYDLETP